MRLIRIEEHDDGASQTSTAQTKAPESAQQSNGLGQAHNLTSIEDDRKSGGKTFSGLRGILRVPTHTVAPTRERRAYARASLTLTLSLKKVAGRPHTDPAALSTQDISSSGIFFLCPVRIEPGTPIEMEVVLVDRPAGQGSVRMRTLASVVRSENTDKPGWHGVAASFDDITFIRDEPLPST